MRLKLKRYHRHSLKKDYLSNILNRLAVLQMALKTVRKSLRDALFAEKIKSFQGIFHSWKCLRHVPRSLPFVPG